MKITPVDNQNNLYLVQDILPKEILQEIEHENLEDYEWEKQEGQEVWKRKKLTPRNTSPLCKIDTFLNSIRLQIADILGVKFVEYDCWSSFWYDQPGFTTEIHLDGALPIAMQLYLLPGNPEHGTVFYHNNQVPWKVRYKFPYIPNSGYIMLNGPNQWHAVPAVVKNGEKRLSSYTYFGKYNHK